MEYLLELKLDFIFVVIGIGTLVLFQLELWMHWKCVHQQLAKCMTYTICLLVLVGCIGPAGKSLSCPRY